MISYGSYATEYSPAPTPSGYANYQTGYSSVLIVVTPPVAIVYYNTYKTGYASYGAYDKSGYGAYHK